MSGECLKDYLNIDIEKNISKCGCFVYDMHDPNSCGMGALYVLSNFGGGQDPWLWISFFCFTFFWVMIYRFNQVFKNGSEQKLENIPCNLGIILYFEKYWGNLYVGGGLSLIFLIMFISRIVFAVSPPNISRPTNVILYPFFCIAYAMVIIGLTNCWWIMQIHIEKMYRQSGDPTKLVTFKEVKFYYNQNSTTRSIYPGIISKSFKFLGYYQLEKNTIIDKIFHVFFITWSIVFIGINIGLVILNHTNENENADAITGTNYNLVFATPMVFHIFIVIVLVDIIVALIIHRHFGCSFALINNEKLNLEKLKQFHGARHYEMYRKCTNFIAGVTFLACGFSFLVLRLDTGHCPFISYEDDLYHGGDPAESAQADLATFLTLLLISNELCHFTIYDSYIYFKPKEFSSTVILEDEKIQANFPMLKYNSDIASSICVGILAVCIVVIDLTYKDEAGMLGRIFYFCGFLIAISMLGDYKIYFVIQCHASKIIRLLGVILILILIIIYILSAILAGTSSNENDSRYENLDVSVLAVSFFIKLLSLLFAFIYDKNFRKYADTDKKSNINTESINLSNNEIELVDHNLISTDHVIMDSKEANKSKETYNDFDASNKTNESSYENKKHFVNRKKDTGFFLVLADFAFIIAGVFTFWVYLAIVWNALALLLVLGIFAIGIGHWIRHYYYKKYLTSSKNANKVKRVTLNFKKKALILFFQVFFSIALFFFSQAFYFLGKRLPFYEKQIFIAGHRGVWLKGYAENSKEANELANDFGYHCAEYDLRMTKDQLLVVMHDVTLERTTNGTGNVFDKDLQWLKDNLVLKKDRTDDLLLSEYPYDLEEMLNITSKEIGLISNVEVKQDKNTSAIALALDAICKTNTTQNSFISTGDPRFQHILYYLEPNITLEKDFLLYTPTMSIMVPFNVNIYAISAELLLFNTWVISNAHAANKMVLVYFLAIETPAMINYFVDMGVDGFMLNSPFDCKDSGLCPPENDFQLPRTIWIGPEKTIPQCESC